MTREALFNFIPQEQLGNHKDEGLIVSIQPSTRWLTFSKKSEETKNLIGRYVKFYVDKSKNTLAWKHLDKEVALDKLKDYNQIKEVSYGGNTQVKVYIPVNVMNELKITAGKQYTKLKVKRYKQPGLLTEEQLSYVSLNVKSE